jgi:hypothetical protein
MTFYTFLCSKPSLIRLHLIRMSDNPDKNMKNEIETMSYII